MEYEPNVLTVDIFVAGLLKDLKRRGLPVDTLVFWAREPDRNSVEESREGRAINFMARPSGWLVATSKAV